LKMNLESLSLTDAADAIRTGTLSPLEYVRALLARVDAVESRVQAWTTIDRDAVLSEARQLETEAHRKLFRGPLHGIPVGVKDIFYTKGLRTTMGSTAFSDFVPTYDSSVVKRLKHAGAIIMGKCVTTVLVFLDPGPTRNPWNTNHTPGGSSSGSAAAVAARMCPVSIGSQTVGSVGRPGAYNGVVSIMPTQSRISLAGAFPLAWSLDHVGAFSRSVGDIEVLVEALSESPMPSHPARALNHRPRIGIVHGFFSDKADAASRDGIETLAGKLEGAGYPVAAVTMPAIFEIHPAILRTIVRSEAAEAHSKLIRNKPEAYGPKLRDLVHLGELIDASDYLRARRIRRHYQRDMGRLFDHVDVLITPGAPGPAPEGMATGDPVMQAPWTLADFPTMTLPTMLASNGLPLGIQLTAAPLHEGLLLETAKAIESVIAFQEKPDL
jgi:aspartyl-tRNA(Asn)/glutamyl-tRNA(Gln) amidotransferase subunit A